MPAVDPVPSSPASDDGSLVFYSSSEEVSTPIERVPTAAIDGAKGDASVGVAVHSPPAMFIGTPFATGTGNTLFEYPFPPTRPALSASSSISSAASSVFGPPSPSTRAKYIPRLAQKQSSSVRRRLSGNSPPAVRIPPRLRTDSAGSIGSVQSTADEPMPKTAPGTSAPRLSPLFRLRDRSGSLGVLPIQLPPPSIATMGLGAPSASPMSPAALVDAMASTGLGVTMTPRSEGEVGDEQAAQAAAAATEKRRASMPALFTPRLGEESGSDSGLDREDVDDIPS